MEKVIFVKFWVRSSLVQFLERNLSVRLKHLFELSFFRLDHSVLRETVVVVDVDVSIFDNDVASNKSCARFSPATRNRV